MEISKGDVIVGVGSVTGGMGAYPVILLSMSEKPCEQAAGVNLPFNHSPITEKS